MIKVKFTQTNKYNKEHIQLQDYLLTAYPDRRVDFSKEPANLHVFFEKLLEFEKLPNIQIYIMRYIHSGESRNISVADSLHTDIRMKLLHSHRTSLSTFKSAR